MPASAELISLRRTLDDLRDCVSALRGRYGDIPAVRRLLGDVDRIELDAHELDDVAPAEPARTPTLELVEDQEFDPAMFNDADSEGLGGYHGEMRRRPR